MLITNELTIIGKSGPAQIAASEEKGFVTALFYDDSLDGLSIHLEEESFRTMIEMGRDFLLAKNGEPVNSRTKPDCVAVPNILIHMDYDEHMVLEPELDGFDEGVGPSFRFVSKDQGTIYLMPSEAQVKALRDCCQAYLDARKMRKAAGKPIRIPAPAKA